MTLHCNSIVNLNYKWALLNCWNRIIIIFIHMKKLDKFGPLAFEHFVFEFGMDIKYLNSYTDYSFSFWTPYGWTLLFYSSR